MEDMFHLSNVPEEPRDATKYVMDKLVNDIHPLITSIRDKIQLVIEEENVPKISEVFTLCSSQVTKCVLGLFEIFRLEYSRLSYMKESRQCNLERLSWCHNRLVSIEKCLERKCANSSLNESADNSFNITTMYFVNWIDHTFEVLNKLAVIVYNTDCKDNEEMYEGWKNDVVECVTSLHITVDELLLCAMTLCKYCLPGDQIIVKARCQVVLRETKALLAEIIEGDLSATIVATPKTLKLPVKPSNINVMIDVLKDVLYILETNTNTALLGLLIHCFYNSDSPVDVLKKHFASNIDGMCFCELKCNEDVTEDCSFVKEFDLYNERLLQIGSFAVSCSSDEKRILSLRSGLASLEALDPHLVPALMTSPDTCHSSLLVKTWKQEVEEIRDNVFLIVDPAAFADKSKQMMHAKLLEVLKDNTYNNANTCTVINIGCVINDFFNVYFKLEPEALAQFTDKLSPLIENLDKVQMECKIVSNLLSSTTDYKYDVKTPQAKGASLEQLFKRLKLFYTLVGRINAILQPKEDLSFENEGEEAAVKNATQTVGKIGTYVNSPKTNMSRSIFARTNVRSSTRNFPLAKLTKHLRCKNTSQLNFSFQLDELLNSSDEKMHKSVLKLREHSVLYNFSPIKNRSSLRKVVLNRHLQNTTRNLYKDVTTDYSHDLLDEDESLQLTEVLNEMNDMTRILSTTKAVSSLATSKLQNNTISINITDKNATISKHVWNIPVNSSIVDIRLDASGNNSNVTQQSNINTLERLSDLDFVESKLHSLKSQFETSL